MVSKGQHGMNKQKHGSGINNNDAQMCCEDIKKKMLYRNGTDTKKKEKKC